MSCSEDLQFVPRNDKADNGGNASPLFHMEKGLDAIAGLLDQMLLLAQTAAGDGDIDRAALQRELEGLRAQIDRLADSLA